MDKTVKQWVFRPGRVVGEVEASRERQEPHRFCVRLGAWESGEVRVPVVEIEQMGAGFKKRFNLRIPVSQTAMVARLMLEACESADREGVAGEAA